MVIYYLLFIVSVAYLTLFERHLLGLAQLRLGSNKPSWRGVLQPLLDALKLLQKISLSPWKNDTLYYYLMPVFTLGLLFYQILVLPPVDSWVSLQYGGLLFLSLIGGSVYFTFFSSYASASNYSYLGSLRSGVQSVSYEIVIFFMIFSLLRLSDACYLVIGGSLLYLPLLVLLFLSLLAEMGRAPFDFTEGESELVSGYNLEFGGVLFVYLFLSEYGFIVLFSCILTSSFFSNFVFGPLFFMYLIVMCRATFPRYRYDILIAFFWRILLPLSMQLFVVYYLLTLL